MEIKIAVAYHKDSIVLQDEHLIPVHVGKSLATAHLPFQGDNTGDNISEKNPVYCELTALYWLWKNVNADYKGLFHYRRAFCIPKDFYLRKIKEHVQQTVNMFLIPLRLKKNSVVSIEYKYADSQTYKQEVMRFSSHLEDELKNGANILAPYPIKLWTSSVYDFFKGKGKFAINLLLEIVAKDYPPLQPYLKMTLQGQILYFGNMEIMDKGTFEDYCSMLFSVLKSHEEETIKRHYVNDLYNEMAYSRMSGYLAEIITCAYIRMSKLTGKIVKEYPVAFLE